MNEGYLFIGGVKDGEWLSVPDNARKWCIPIMKFEPLSKFSDSDTPPNFGFNDILQQTYIKVCMDSNPSSKLYVFVLDEMYVNNTHWYWDIICKLVNNYKVIK